MRLLREPLVQFLLLGAVLYGAQVLLGGRLLAGGDTTLVVDQQLADWLAASEARSLGRAPTAAEVDAAVQRHVRMQALRSEARRLGLDQGDPIVGRRLEQKMEFLLEGAPPPPGEAELAAWLAAHPERYRRPDVVAIEHRFFRERDAVDPEAPGEPFLAGATARGSAEVLDARFGPGFGAAVLALDGQGWLGPVRSTYGWHLVRITERVPGGLPALAEVRADVARDLLAERTAAERERRIDALVDGLDVRIEADLAAAAASAGDE